MLVHAIHAMAEHLEDHNQRHLLFSRKSQGEKEGTEGTTAQARDSPRSVHSLLACLAAVVVVVTIAPVALVAQQVHYQTFALY